jgi:NAD(P)-dependent dehydrogenase (short-subunit alcohol dehydrogenase family)
MPLLDGLGVLVLGGGRGIGLAEATCFAALGANVLVNDLGCEIDGSGADPAIARAAAESLKVHGGICLHDARDITAPGVIAELVARARTELGGLGAVVHAAGVHHESSAAKTQMADVDRALGVHVVAAFETVRAASSAFIDAGGGGAIVLHTSPTAFFGASRQALPAASSAAVVGLVRSCAVELRRHGIRVNAIAPTARTRQTEESPLFRSIQSSSMTTEHVANVAAWLVSSLGTEVTGQIVGIAGSRLYALLGRESTGFFSEARVLGPEDVAAAWGVAQRA